MKMHDIKIYISKIVTRFIVKCYLFVFGFLKMSTTTVMMRTTITKAMMMTIHHIVFRKLADECNEWLVGIPGNSRYSTFYSSVLLTKQHPTTQFSLNKVFCSGKSF